MVNATLSEIAQIWERVLDRLSQKINDRHIFDSFLLILTFTRFKTMKLLWWLTRASLLIY
jgi:hypothetical protein